MPLLWISLAFLAGLVLGNYLPWTVSGWLTAAAIPLILWPVLRRLPGCNPIIMRLRWVAQTEVHLFVPPLLLATALAFGAARITASGPDIYNGHIAAYNNRGEFRLTAVVDTPPDRRDKSTLYRLRAEQLAPLNEAGIPGPSQPTHGLVLALIPGRADWQYGDRLTLDGKLVTPPEDEDFSYRAYLARQDVYTYLTYPRVRLLAHNAGNPISAAVYHLRDWAYAETFHLYPAPEAPLLAGILLGVDSDLPDSLARAFQDTGTAHIIAISGFNIAILAELFSKLFGRIFSRWWALLMAVLAIAAYSLMVGATPSVVRAAVMGSLALIAQQIGRRTTGANALALTAAVMCLFTPRLPWDISFQLSFGATLGLILYGDRLQQGFTGLLEHRLPAETAQKVAGPVGEYVLMTLAAQLLTLPVILYHFKRLSLSSLIANPLVLPPQPLVMVFSGVAVLVGAICDPLAHLLAWLAWPLSAYTNRMVETLASIPNGVLVLGDMNLWTVALMYTAVLAPVFSKTLPARIKKAVTPTITVVALALIAALVWRGAAAAPDGRLHLLVYDINGSQALLMRGPNGETLLINGGSSARMLNDAMDRWLSPFDRRLDGVLINTTQTSTWNSLAGILDSHPLQHLWWGIPPPESRSTQALVDALQAKQVIEQQLDPGDTLSIGQDVHLKVLASGEIGSALMLRWENFRVLIPSGTTPSQFSPEDLTHLSLILLEPRDLEKTSAEQWLSLTPQAIIATPGNTPFPPSGYNWLNTQPTGWYAVTTNGKQMWMEKK